jgi:glycosyltransferase involved in cell wall biosynthesis
VSTDHLEVGFDVTPVISGSTGIARYVRELGTVLAEQDVGLNRFAIGRNNFPVPEGARHLPVPARLMQRSWRTLRWPRLEQLIGDVDIVHATGPLIPATRRPMAVTVHDVAALRYPELHPARSVQQQQALMAALRRADVIIAVSQATADDLAYVGGRSDRLAVAPLGLTPLPVPTAHDARLPERFLLTVGESSPRKGYPVLLRALAQAPGDHRLVMVGPPAGDERRVRSLIAELGLEQQVTRLGSVSDSALAALYRDALALCFPSVSEGFGLPVLEAMAAGLPVVAADIPATREVAGDAAVLVPASDVGAWADAIAALASDSAMRERLTIAGRRRGGEFTWERTAKATIEAYRLALR